MMTPETDMIPRSMTDALAELFKRGWTGNFAVEAGGKVRIPQVDTVPADKLVVDEMHRFEGATDPSDESVVVACRYTHNGKEHKGALVLSYGPAGSAEDADVLLALQDERSDKKQSKPTR